MEGVIKYHGKDNEIQIKTRSLADPNNIQLQTHTEPQKGAMYLEENSVIFIITGKLTVNHGLSEEQAGENEMIFLKKDILINYTMEACDSDNRIEYMVFNLRPHLVTEFVKMADLSIAITPQSLPFIVSATDDTFSKFIASLHVCLTYPSSIQSKLSKLKLLELLFYLASYNPAILNQLLQLRESFQANITTIIEENILNSMSLQQLAVLAGRSLSSFRRDFLSIYNIPPSQWIRQRRLEKAKELLCSTTMSITDICYTTGFENIAHFSRLFKSHFCASPSEFRQNVSVA
jgi:AraC-like DNA-binding protein